MIDLRESVGLPHCIPGGCTFAQFFRSSREAMYISSREGVLVDVNHAFEELLGYPPGGLKGTHVQLLLDSDEDRGRYQKTIEADGVVHDYPLVLRRRDGALIFCMLDAVVWQKDGMTAGYHGIVRTKVAVMESFRIFFNRLKEEKHRLREERRNLVSDTQLLSRYMTDDMLDYIQKTGRNPLETGMVKATILFFDIRNSTGIAEKLRPEEFASFLSDILTDVMDLVYGCQGSVNKLLGDGLMASFGVPMSSGTDAFNAVEAAQKIVEYLRTFNDVRPGFLVDEVAAGIGIATGTVFAGVIGSVRRQEYALLGDPVNIASRLESLTKSLDETVLMDEETFVEIKDRFLCKPLLRAKLRGRETAVKLYGLR